MFFLRFITDEHTRRIKMLHLALNRILFLFATFLSFSTLFRCSSNVVDYILELIAIPPLMLVDLLNLFEYPLQLREDIIVLRYKCTSACLLEIL